MFQLPDSLALSLSIRERDHFTSWPHGKGSWEFKKQHDGGVERHPERDPNTSKTATDDPLLASNPRR